MLSIWANEECTSRPVGGQTYATLYARIDGTPTGAMEWVDPAFQSGSSEAAKIQWDAALNEYGIELHFDYQSDTLTSPLVKGDVVELTHSSGTVIWNADYMVDFPDY